MADSKTLVNGSRGVIVKMHLCPVVRDLKHTQERLIRPEEHEKFPGRRYEDLKYGMKLEFERRNWTIFKVCSVSMQLHYLYPNTHLNAFLQCQVCKVSSSQIFEGGTSHFTY
jgi:hypothetical protein